MNTAVPFPVKHAVVKMPTLTAMGLGSKSAIYEEVRDETFPPPVKLSRRNAVWPLDEVERIAAARIRGADKAELQALTAEILAARKHRA